MIELGAPKQDCFEQINTIFQDTIHSLPLDGCEMARNPHLNGRLEFIAPDGFAFRVEGIFEADDAPETFSPTNPSDPESSVPHFYGTRLQIALGEQGITYYGEQPKPQYMRHESDYFPHITIGTPLDFVMSGATHDYSWEQHMGSGRYTIAQVYDPYGGEPIPCAAYASGWLSEIDITLVAGNYEARKFELPINPLVKKALTTFRLVEPHATPTEGEYREAIGRSAIGDVDGFVQYKKQQYRELGIPFRDDLLRDIEIVRNDENGKVPSVLKLLEKIHKENEYLGLKTSAARRSYQFKQKQTALISNRAQKLEKKLFVCNTRATC